VVVAPNEASTPSQGSQPGSGSVLADITREMVRMYKDCYGKGPTKARTSYGEDLVVCLLEGGFQEGERTLRNAGRGDVVSANRETFQEVLRERFIGTVEELTGRKVRAFISGVDLGTEVSAEVFVLEPVADVDLEVGDEREAVRAWAEQTRRSSRSLREEQAALREQAQHEQERVTRHVKPPERTE
jgi:uncharacterized protein YbcI